jgi:hypothetical protein
MESKLTRKSDNEAKRICNDMTLDKKIKIIDKLRGGMSAAAADPKIRRYVILKVRLSVDILL